MGNDYRCEYENVLKIINNDKFMIFGTGISAENAYQALKSREMLGNFEGFIVSKLDDARQYHGYDVLQIGDRRITLNIHILIATYEPTAKEVMKILKERGYERCMWISQVIDALFYGLPLMSGKRIEISTLVKSVADSWNFGIRWLVIQEYYGQNEVGYDLYRKMCKAMLCKDSTVQSRLDSFRGLISSFRSGTFNENESRRQVCVNSKMQIIDGWHRLATAFYHGWPYLKVDIYGKSDYFDAFIENQKTDIKIVAGKYFTDREIKLIYKARQEVLDKCHSFERYIGTINSDMLNQERRSVEI